MNPNDFEPRPTFEGFPYLVTRIGHTPLRHVSLLPADWPLERLLDIARRQVAANRMDACLCLSRQAGVYLSPDGAEHVSSSPVVWGLPLTGRLQLPEILPDSDELRDRRRALDEFIDREGKGAGYIVGDGLSGGRHASPAQIARLSGRGPDGIPRGLEKCSVCGKHRGDFLAVNGEGSGDMTPRVVEVFCGCQNHNRCARCGRPLAKGRLSAWEYFPEMGRILYLSAYAGLDHRCDG